MVDNKFDQYRPEVCPEIEKQCNKDIGLRFSINVNLFYLAYSIVALFNLFETFLNIFSNIFMPLCRVYIIIPRYVGPRIKRGCF